MKTTTIALLMLTQAYTSGCRTNESSLDSDLQQASTSIEYSFAVKMNSVDSAQFMAILAREGIDSTAPGLGVTKYEFSSIYCAILDAGTEPSCQLVDARRAELKTSRASQSSIYKFLVDHGGRYLGPSNEPPAVWVTRVECSKVVAPNAVADCSLLAKHPQKTTSAGPGAITLTAADSDLFIKALKSSHLANSAQSLGKEVYKLSGLLCSKTVVPGAVASCEMRKIDGTRQGTFASDASIFFPILKAQGAVSGAPVLGKESFEVQDIECSKVVAPGAQATCAFSSSSGQPSIVTLDVKNSDALMNSLTLGGAPRSSQGLGSEKVELRQVYCMNAVAPNAIPRCRFQTPFSEQDLSSLVTKQVFAILLANGGRYNDGTLGADKAAVADLTCTKNVTPDAHAECLFTRF